MYKSQSLLATTNSPLSIKADMVAGCYQQPGWLSRQPDTVQRADRLAGHFCISRGGPRGAEANQDGPEREAFREPCSEIMSGIAIGGRSRRPWKVSATRES